MLTNEATKIAVESGKLLIIFNINEVHQLNPNATHVTNNYYGEEFVPDDGLQKPTFHATRNFPKIPFWSMSCAFILPMCARSGGTSIGRCGWTSSNCLPWPIKSSTKASSRTPLSTGIWWETFCTCWLKRRF